MFERWRVQRFSLLHTPPHQAWRPLSFLFHWYRVFPLVPGISREQSRRDMVLTTCDHLAPRLSVGGAICHAPTLWLQWHVTGRKLPLHNNGQNCSFLYFEIYFVRLERGMRTTLNRMVAVIPIIQFGWEFKYIALNE